MRIHLKGIYKYQTKVYFFTLTPFFKRIGGCRLTGIFFCSFLRQMFIDDEIIGKCMRAVKGINLTENAMEAVEVLGSAGQN